MNAEIVDSLKRIEAYERFVMKQFEHIQDPEIIKEIQMLLTRVALAKNNLKMALKNG